MHAEKYSIFMFPLLIILRRNVEVMHNPGFQIVPWFSLVFFSNAGDLKFETSGVSSNGSCCLIDLMNAKRWEIQFFNEFCLSSSKLNLWVWVRWISTQSSRSHGSWHSLKFPWSELPISSVIWTWRYISFKTHDICILRSFQEVIPFLSMLRILPNILRPIICYCALQNAESPPSLWHTGKGSTQSLLDGTPGTRQKIKELPPSVPQHSEKVLRHTSPEPWSQRGSDIATIPSQIETINVYF